MSQHAASQSLILSAVMLAGVAPVTAPAADGAAVESASAQPGTGNLQATLDSKMRLVKLLLDQSPAVLRIPQSGNAQARKELADAQAGYALAGKEAAAGRIDKAIAALDDALRRIVSASHMVPDPAQIAAQERARYARLNEAIGAFRSQYAEGGARADRTGKAASPDELKRIAAMVEKADALAAGGNHAQANAVLADAYRMVVTTLNRMLASTTVVYDATFASPAEEYAHELARNRSYEELIPIALVQLQSSREIAALADRYVAQSRSLRDTAGQKAASGDHRGAVQAMQEATAHLQRALRSAGLVVPQTDGKP